MTATIIAFPRRRAGTEPWATKRQVAAHLGVSERTVERYVDRGMPAHKTGDERTSSVRFLLSEVDDWMGGDAA